MDAKVARAAPQIDFERFRLRRYIDALPPEELERRNSPIDLADLAAVLDGNTKAVLFEKAGAEGAALVGNVCASRSRLALAFDSTPGEVTQEIRRRLGVRQEIVEVARERAPVQAVVLEGDSADLTALPAHLQHGLDGAPYISASIDYTVDRDRGWTNIGMRRLMLRGRRETGVDLVAPSDLRAIYESQMKRGEHVPVAFVVGAHPIDCVAATMRIPMDELALLASLRGAPLPVVKCVTNDIRVPADAEWVLEGYFDSKGYVEPEGPYGEFLGYYGVLKKNPMFRLTAITRREDALFQTATIGSRMLGRTDTSQLNALRSEVTLWRALETAVREVKAVYATPHSGGAFNVRIAMRQRVPGEARNAIAAAFGCLVNAKHVFVVDPDVDIFSDAQMDWALATRFQADRDLVVQTGMRAMPLDPSLGPTRTWTKAGFDLTLPFLAPGQERSIEFRVPSPPDYECARFASVEAALADGPKYFQQLMGASGSRDGREVVRELEALRGKRGYERDSEGRYFLK